MTVTDGSKVDDQTAGRGTANRPSPIATWGRLAGNVAFAGSIISAMTPSRFLLFVAIGSTVSALVGFVACLISLFRKLNPVAVEGLVLIVLAGLFLSSVWHSLLILGK